MNDIALLDATAQAELVRKKQVKPIELVEAAIERIERVNPQINAVVTPMYDITRKAAEGPLPEGPFTGVPFLLKDLTVEFAGSRFCEGSRFLKDWVSKEDNELCRRHKNAGLLVVGKTNTPEFGLVPTTEPFLFGPSRNPWDITRTTGGSSGGSAAAVAAGIVPMAHGNDGGGSIRIPASCNGLFGLKPTRARNPFGISVLSQDHAITRSVRDSAALLDATAGPTPGDPYLAPPPARPWLSEVSTDPGRLRIAFSIVTPTGVILNDDCIAAVKDAASLLEDLGHQVVEAQPNAEATESLVQSFTVAWAAGSVDTIDTWAQTTGRTPTPDQFEPLTWAFYEMGQATTAGAYLHALHEFDALSRAMAAFFQDYDLWLTATLGAPPVPLGWFDAQPDDPMAGFARAAEFVPYTPIFNATGQPGMSVPLYWNSAGLPVGTHFAARFGDEATLFRLAAQLEEARPWANRRPPVSAV